MPKLKIVWDVHQRSTFCFRNLKDRCDIFSCPKLKDVSWLIYARNLETLSLHDLGELEDVISGNYAGEIDVFSRLKYLKLDMLMNLKKICSHTVKFFFLEFITVKKCPQLMRLPFDINSDIPSTLQRIEGYQEWWEKLEWEDETTKSNLAPYFVDTGS
ncbi:hypothetical protein MKW92_053868 [Papaver armeniacum]|nr:hypothetical protein MKW92_053868 [Papaver armeniacum]